MSGRSRGKKGGRIRGEAGRKVARCCCDGGTDCCTKEDGPPTASFSVTRISRFPCVYELADTSTLGTCSDEWRSQEKGGRRFWGSTSSEVTYTCVGPVDDPCSVIRLTIFAPFDGPPIEFGLRVWDAAGCSDGETVLIDPCQPCVTGDLVIGTIGATKIADNSSGHNCWQFGASIAVHECTIPGVTITFQLAAWVPTRKDGFGRPDFSGPYDWGGFPGSYDPATQIACIDCTYPSVLVRVTAHATDRCGCQDQKTQEFTLDNDGDPCGCCHTNDSRPGSIPFTMEGWVGDVAGPPHFNQCATSGECDKLNATFSLTYAPVPGNECRYRFFEDAFFSCAELGITMSLEILLGMFEVLTPTGPRTAYAATIILSDHLGNGEVWQVAWQGVQSVPGACGVSTPFKTILKTAGGPNFCGGIPVRGKVG